MQTARPRRNGIGQSARISSLFQGIRIWGWMRGVGLTVGLLVSIGGVRAQVPAITARPLSRAVMEGQSVTFSVGVNGDAGLSYQWMRNGQVIAGATSATLTLSSVTMADRGWYRVAVSNGSGVATSVLRLEVGANNTSVVSWGTGPVVPANFGPVLMLASSPSGGTVLALKPDGTVSVLDPSGSGSANVPADLTGVVGLSTASGSVAVKADGTVVAWGGVSKPPTGLNQVVAVSSGQFHALGLKADGTVAVWGDGSSNASAVLRIPAGLHDVVAIASGRAHCLVLLADGSMFAWGSSGSETTVPLGLTDVVAVAAGSNYNLVLRADGSVRAWGQDYAGDTVVPTGLGVITAIAAGSLHNLVLKADGTVVAFGRSLEGQTAVPAGLSQVCSIAATNNQSLVLATKAVPAFITQPQGRGLTVDDYVTFTAAATGLTPLTYQWKKDGVALTDGGVVSGATTANLVINGVPASAAGGYTVDATNPFGTVTSEVAVLTVKVPPTLTARPRSQLVTVGQPVAFSVTATDPGTITYQWKRNGQLIAAATEASLSIASVSPADRGYYEVAASNGTAVSTSVFMLNVSTVPTSGLVVVPWGDGSSNYGQRTIPSSLSGVVAVSAGTNHVLALKSNGTVVAWGLSNYGATAVPAGLSDVVAVTASDTYSVALKADGRLVTWGDQTADYKRVPGSLRGIVAIAARQDNFVALKSDGTVFSPNSVAPADLAGVAAIAAGAGHGLALKSDGTVVGWGVAVLSPVANMPMAAPAGLAGIVGLGVGRSQSMVLQNDGKVTAWGRNDERQTAVPTGLGTIAALDGGASASFALLADGSVVGWGGDSHHEISGVAGLGGVAAISIADYYGLALVSPTAPQLTLASASQTANIGSTITLVGKAVGYPIPALQWRLNGTVIAGATASTLTLTNVQVANAGDYTLTATNTQGSVTSSAITLSVVASVNISARTLSQLIPVGQPATLSVTASGTGTLTYQWRHNGVTIPGATAGTYTIPAVTSGDGGYYDVLARDAVGGTARSVTYLNVVGNQGTVIGWGDNGSEVTAPVGLTDAVAAAAGDRSSMVLRANGTVLAWGGGSAVPSGLIGVVAIAAGDSHRIALKSDGTVAVWGSGGYNETDVPAGLGNVVAVAASGHFSAALRADCTVVTWGYGTSQNTALTDAVAIAVGGSVVAVRTDGTVTAWGGSDANTVPADCTNVATITAGGGSYLALRHDGSLSFWGTNTVTPPAGLGVPIAMALNSYYAFALKSDGGIAAWGSNRNNSTLPQMTVPPGMPPAFGLAAGPLHLLALVTAVPAAPTITAQPLAQTVTYGQSATFAIVATGTPVLTYQWRKDGSTINGSASTLTLSNIQESDAGTYSVIVRNGQGSVTSADAVLTVQKTAVSAQSVPVAGGGVTLAVNAPTATAYQWRYRGTVLAGQTSATLTLTNLSRAQNGDYDVVLTTPAGSQTAFSYRLDVQPATMPDLYQTDAAFAPRFEQEGAGAIKAALKLPDGKFLVGGDFTRLGGTPALYLARLNADGSVDGTFSAPVFSGAIRVLARQADGKIYAGGDFAFVNQQRSGGLVRLNADFSVDPGFAVGQGFEAPVLALALQSDGRVIVGGEFYSYGATNRARLIRLNADATADLTLTYNNTIGPVRVIRLQDDGKVMIAGGNDYSDSTASKSGYVMRLLPTGGSDWTTWGNGSGARTYNVPVFALVQQTDGGWIVGCRSDFPGEAVLERLTPAGLPDATFVFDATLKAQALGVEFAALGADGKILVAGPGLPLTRLTAKGAPDTSLPASPYASGSISFAGNESDGGLRLWGAVAPAAGAITITGFTVLSADGSAFGPFTGSVPRREATIYDAQIVAPNRVLVRGSFTHVNDVARAGLARLGTDGTVDAAFQAPVLPLTDTGRMALQGDGRILLHDGVSLARLQANGTRDVTFASINYAAGDVAVDHDGRVLIANGGAGGYFGTTSGVRRLTATGALDAAFSTTVTGFVTNLVQQSNGRIVLGGQYGSVNGQSVNGLVRVFSDGTLDQSYSTSYTSGYRIYPAGNDLLYVGPNDSSGSGGFLRRQTVTGASDATFSSYPSNSTNVVGSPTVILPLPDGRFLRASPPIVSALNISTWQMGRHLANGAVDSTFGVDGLDRLDTKITRLLLLDDGSVWLFGSKLTAAGAPRSGVVRLAAAQPLSISVPPVSVQAAVDGSTALSVTTAGTGPIAYQWYRNGMKIPGATAATLALTHLTLADAASYVVTAASPFGSVTSTPVTISGPNPAPTITAQPVSQLASAGDAATFSVGASGVGSLSYQWRRSSFPIPGATGASYTNPHASRSDAGIYDVLVADGLSVTVSDGVKLDVAPSGYPNTLKPDPTFAPRFETTGGTINAILPTPDGRFIVSGDFTRLNGVERPGLARVDASFQVDTAFVPPALFSDVASNLIPEIGTSRAMAVLADGKILVTHALPSVGEYPYRNTLVRLLADGSIDPAFTASVEPLNVARLAVQPDGGIIVIGYQFSVTLPTGRRYVYRLRADGSLDASYAPIFGTAGSPTAPGSVVAQADGKAVFGGISTVNGMNPGPLVRLTADGAIDPAFALTGLASGSVTSLAVLSDGRLLVGGSFTVSGSNNAKLGRTTAGGAWETALLSNTDSPDSIARIYLQADGKIWAAATTSSGAWTAWRLSAAGAIEQKFFGTLSLRNWDLAPVGDGRLLAALAPSASSGLVAARFAANGVQEAVTAQAELPAGVLTAVAAPGGKFYVSGEFARVNGVPRTRLARLNADGSLDAAFVVGTGFDQVPQNLLVQPDGRLLVNGSFTTYQGAPVAPLIRVNSDGTRDPSFTVAVPQNTTAPIGSLSLLRDGRVLVNGSLCYFGDGSRDAAFAPTRSGSFAGVPLPNGDVLVGGTTVATGNFVSVLRPDSTTRTTSGVSLSYFTSLGVQPDGKIFVGGGVNSPPSGYSLPTVRRLTAGLGSDTGFAQSGMPTPPFTTSSYRGPQLLVQEDGRVLLNDYYGFFRLAATGARDTAFVQADVALVQPSGSFATRGILVMLLLDDGRMLLGDDTLGVSGLRRRGLVRLTDEAAVTFPTQPADQVAVVGGALNLSVTVSGAGPLTYQWFRNGIAIGGATHPALVISGVVPEDAGSYSVAVTNANGTVRSFGASVVVNAVSGAAQTISFQAPANRIYGDAPVSVNATSDSALPVTIAVVSGPATLANGSLTLIGAGTVTLRASQLGDANYTAATSVERSFTVAPAPLTVTAANQSRVYGAANPALTFAYAGFVNNDTAASLTAAPTASTTAAISSAPGVYPITLSGGSAANYALTLVNGTLTVTPRDYRGTYFGTFASGGHWALAVNANATATYIAYLPSRHSAIVVSLTVNPDGTFTVTGTEIKPLATAVSGYALASPEAPALRSAAATGDFTLSGQIAADGAVSGALTGLGETLTGAADTGTAQTAAGLYTAAALNTASGATYTIVGASGQAVVVTTTPAAVDGAAGTVNASGQLTATTSNNAALSLTINAAAQTVSASLTPAGASAPITYAGLSAAVTPIARVVNLSVRTTAGTGDQTLIVGLVVIGSGNKTLLLRGIGPALLPQGVTNALADPTMRLLNGSGAEVAANNDWGGSAQMSANFSSVGAFALPTNSKDAALFNTLPTGLYSFHVFPNGAGTGIALAEVYDADDDSSAASVFNISARTQVGTGENILIAGFVITGNSPKTLLIRGLGPTLAAQGVTGALVNPQLFLFGSAGLIASNDDWGGTTALKNAFAVTGAGSLASDTSKDAALLVTLQPGVYSAQVSGVGSTTGIGLVEIFLVP
jgi:uncharacterized delta-60 repeat protein